MTRAEFFKRMFHVNPEVILVPLQDTAYICKNIENCSRKKCEGCKYSPSYWNSKITLHDFSKILSSLSSNYKSIIGMKGWNYEKVDKNGEE